MQIAGRYRAYIQVLRHGGSARLGTATLAILLSLTLVSPAHAQGCVPLPPYAVESDRIGINVVVDDDKGAYDYDIEHFGAGWFLDYQPQPYVGSSAASADAVSPAEQAADPAPSISSNSVRLPVVFWGQTSPRGISYVHTFRTTDLDGEWRNVLDRLIVRYPAMLLIVGNEPDRPVYQDDQLPAEYAKMYHDVYEYVKQRDPTITVAIAGVVQPTPIRLAYLDMVLDAYNQMYGTKMPIDAWTVHAFILREVNASDLEDKPYEIWGAGIPPGITDYSEQKIYDVKDHGDIEILKQLVRDFRRWMTQRGYRNTPLLVTEYGILMPPDYDAGNGRVFDYEFVKEFLHESNDFFFTATDGATGYPADGNRLVQAWAWYALNSVVNSYLVEHDSGVITQLGEDFANLTGSYGANTMFTDLAMHSVAVSGTSIPAGVAGQEITVSFSMHNRGNTADRGAVVSFWLGDPGNGGSLLATRSLDHAVPSRCQELYEGEATIALPALAAGSHQLTVSVQVAHGAADLISQNNSVTLGLTAQ